MKKQILLITRFAIYIIDPEIYALKRRIPLAAIEKLSLSHLTDHFLAVIVPTEYDLLLASTRKTQIVTVLVETTSNYELEVNLSDRCSRPLLFFNSFICGRVTSICIFNC